MLQAYKTRMNISLAIWLVFVLAQVALAKSGYGNSIFGNLSWIAAMAAMISACYASAKGKGHTGVLGLLGVLSLLGFIILIFFPDKNK